MSYRCAKYVGEQSEWHPGPLTWPGREFPYLGEFNGIYDDLMDFVPFVFFKSRLFNLSDEADTEYYTWVKDRIVNGWFLQYASVVTPKETETGVIIYIYLEWGQPYLIQVKKSNLEQSPNDQRFDKYHAI